MPPKPSSMPLRERNTSKNNQTLAFDRQKVTKLPAGVALYWPGVAFGLAEVKQKRAEVTSDDAEVTSESPLNPP